MQGNILLLLENIIDNKGNVNTGLLESYLSQLPETFLRFSMKVILSLIVFLIGMKMIQWLRKILRKALIKVNADKGVIQFIDALLKVVLITLLVLTIASRFGLEATSVVAVLGSVSIAIGLALQGSLSNFAGGILILLLKPFRVGDYIIEDTKGNEGTVSEISLFYTKLITIDDKVIVLPNGILANNSLTNITGTPNRKIDIKISISYKANIEQARKVILGVIDEETKILQEEEKIVFVHELADSGVILGIRCYTKNADYWIMRWKLMELIKNAFDENKIEIPYPQLDVHMNTID